MKVRRTAVMTALAAGLALAGATPAAAATPTFGAMVPSTFQEVLKAESVPPSGLNSATAPCPAGKAAVSVGGFSSASGGSAAGLAGITPGVGNTSGVATARADRNEQNAHVIAQVTCAPSAQLAGSTLVTHETSVHSSLGEWSTIVNCPAGMRAFDGGGYFRARNGTVSTDGFLLSANTLSVNARTWIVSAVDKTFSDTLVVTARCVPESSSTRLVEEVFPVVPQPGTTGGRVDGYAHCPAGFLPISGGAQFTQDGSPLPSLSGLTESTLVRGGIVGWHASGFSQGEHAALHVVALCGS
jgi:hypothetical protein